MAYLIWSFKSRTPRSKRNFMDISSYYQKTIEGRHIIRQFKTQKMRIIFIKISLRLFLVLLKPTSKLHRNWQPIVKSTVYRSRGLFTVADKAHCVPKVLSKSMNHSNDISSYYQKTIEGRHIIRQFKTQKMRIIFIKISLRLFLVLLKPTSKLHRNWQPIVKSTVYRSRGLFTVADKAHCAPKVLSKSMNHSNSHVLSQIFTVKEQENWGTINTKH